MQNRGLVVVCLLACTFVTACPKQDLEGLPCDDAGECAEGFSCNAANECVSERECANGSWDNDGDSATNCVAHSDCVPGQSVVSEGNATVDRECVVCESGFFSSTINSGTCIEKTACIVGEEIGAEGDANTDRVCRSCTEGASEQWSIVVDRS